ncbi:hypothetical protein BWX39_11565 [Prevotella intermedia ATCC 25611 = DSM 20706]|nr:hypothetical protein BWX39_11565 [Prevotella intermedia ATCC 25611 = DSM 20706]
MHQSSLSFHPQVQNRLCGTRQTAPTLSPLYLIIYRQNTPRSCKHFPQPQQSHNHLCTNTLQNLLFCIPKA